jgi:hypothetical protein
MVDNSPVWTDIVIAKHSYKSVPTIHNVFPFPRAPQIGGGREIRKHELILGHIKSFWKTTYKLPVNN